MQPVSVQEVSRGRHHEDASHQTAIVQDSTDRTWVVRVPLTSVAGAELERNESLVAQLGKHLPFKVPAATGFASLGREQGRAAVYPYVEGSALNLHHVPAGPGLASAVGRAIAAVHNIPCEVFEEYSVPSFDAAGHRDRCVSELDRAAATGLVPTGLLARWEEAFDAPALWNFAPTPVHGSINGWAFLVAFTDDDAATGRVVALTHWDQAMVTDPAQDFAAMVDHLTPAALDTVLESYSMARSSRPDPHLVNRSRLAAEMGLIAGLAKAAATGADSVVSSRVEELRKLDRLTASDHSLVPVTTFETTTSAIASDADSESFLSAESQDERATVHIEDEPFEGEPMIVVEDEDESAFEVEAAWPMARSVDVDQAEELQDPTETLPKARLGSELDDTERRQDLYDILDEFPQDDSDEATTREGDTGTS